MTAQELKNSILQMAVQGKLVPQDPSDEPASVLLERIRAEKERLIREGKIKREKAPSVIFRGADNTPYEKVGDAEPVSIADEVPFDIPDSWEWIRLGSLIQLQSGQDLTPDKYNSNGDGIPYITGASNIENGSVIINRWTKDGRAFAYYGDILLTCKGTVGTMAVLHEAVVHIARQIMAIRPYDAIYKEYVILTLESLVAQLKAAAKSMIPGIAREDVLAALIPLPPRPEQERIVEKYQRVLPVIQSYDSCHRELSSLNEAFPDQLRKSILQLAVQGKLVPQDPTDEPASVLWERIRAEKERLIAAGKIKRDKHESIIFRRDNSHYEKSEAVERCIDDELPFEIPDTWCWVTLGQIILSVADGPHFSPQYLPTGIPIISTRNISSGQLDLSSAKYISESLHQELCKRCRPKKGDVLYSKGGTTGIAAVNDTDIEFSVWVHVAVLSLGEYVYPWYLATALNSPFCYSQSQKYTHGTSNRDLGLTRMVRILLPLPPYSEQIRICRQLEEVMEIQHKLT